MFQGFSVINLASILGNIRDTKGKASRSEVRGFCGMRTEIYREGKELREAYGRNSSGMARRATRLTRM
jgi:hypothetical protein